MATVKLKAVSRGTPTTSTHLARTSDAFSNPAARLGVGTQNLMQATEYPLMRLTQNYQLLNSLYRGNWIVQNVINTIPEDITKKWFKVTSNVAPDMLSKLNKLMRTTRLRKSVLEGMKWGRLYGGAIGLILIDGQDDLEKPLNLDEIMPDSFRGLYIVDRWNGAYPSMSLVSDINDPNYGYPEFYEIRNEAGSVQYKAHHSRCIRFIGRELPWVERVAELHWGQSEIEAIYEEIVKHDNVSANIASLTFKANQTVLTMDNIDQMFAIGGGEVQRRFWNQMQAISVLESNLGTRILNKGDTLQQYQYTFAGLADVYNALMMDITGASHIPATKLFGRSPAGMNATGESDLQNYYDYAEERREIELSPVVEQLLPILALSAWGVLPDDIDYVYDNVRNPTESEKAEIAHKKSMTLIEVFNANGMTQEAFLKELKALSDESGMYASITDEMIAEGAGVWAKDLQSMNDPMMGLMGGAGVGGDIDADLPSMAQDTSLAPGTVGIIVMKDGKFLIAKRSDGQGWASAGGHIDLGETPEQAARRELQEEFGLLAENLVPLNQLNTLSEEYGSPHIFLCTKCGKNRGEIATDGEMSDFTLVEPSALKTIDLFPPFKESLGLLADYLARDGETTRVTDDFDPDQPRDGDGKFGSGGGSGSGENGESSSAEKHKQVENAIERLSAGESEVTISNLRDDLERYGGTNDITLIQGDKKKGLVHIEERHGAETVPKVIDAVVDGNIVKYVAAKKTIHVEKDGYEAVLSLDEHGEKKTWLLTGWKIG
ncbi:MAG: DUF1073 domain-containing protein [Oscillospiraceae bacterium]|nr:DUF1073 domain-containing protein [Oscillospiraceae bacterium]